MLFFLITLYVGTIKGIFCLFEQIIYLNRKPFFKQSHKEEDYVLWLNFNSIIYIQYIFSISYKLFKIHKYFCDFVIFRIHIFKVDKGFFKYIHPKINHL